MTLNLFDTSPVNLDGHITSTSQLNLVHGDFVLSGDNDKLLNELRALASAEIVVLDVRVGTIFHEAHAWEVQPDGSLLKWARATSGGSSVSGPRASMDADVIVVAVPPDVAVPEQPPQAGPPAPGTTQKKIRVKIGQLGSLPF